MTEADYVAGNPAHNGTARLVAISGCSGGGKSTLLEAMSQRGYPVMPEPGRQIVKEQLYIGGTALPWQDGVKFCELCLVRGMQFFNLAVSNDKPVLFDRSIIDAAHALLRLGVQDPSLSRAIERYRYADKVFLTPPWPELFDTDEERRHSFEQAETEYHNLVAAYREYGYDVVIFPKDSVSARADFLEEALTSL